MKKIVLAVFFVLIVLLSTTSKTIAQTQSEQKNYQATITQILEKKTSGNLTAGEMFQKLELLVSSEGELYQQKIKTNMFQIIFFPIGKFIQD